MREAKLVDGAIIARQIVGPGCEFNPVRKDLRIEPLAECCDLLGFVRKMKMHGAQRNAGALGRLAGRERVSPRLGQLLGERFEDRRSRGLRLRFAFRADVAPRRAHPRKVIPCLAPTRTISGMSGGFISTSSASSLKNFEALPLLTMVR